MLGHHPLWPGCQWFCQSNSLPVLESSLFPLHFCCWHRSYLVLQSHFSGLGWWSIGGHSDTGELIATSVTRMSGVSPSLEVRRYVTGYTEQASLEQESEDNTEVRETRRGRDGEKVSILAAFWASGSRSLTDQQIPAFLPLGHIALCSNAPICVHQIPSYFCHCDVGVREWETKVPSHKHG